MYQIKRNRVVEDLHLEDGEKVLDLKVDMAVDGMLQRYTSAVASLEAAKAAASKEMTEERITKLGESIVAVLVLIFGEHQTEQLVEFYDGAYTEMLADLTPFIRDEVTPKIHEAQKRITDQYRSVKRPIL
jgi:hypothetical protein